MGCRTRENNAIILTALLTSARRITADGTAVDEPRRPLLGWGLRIGIV